MTKTLITVVNRVNNAAIRRTRNERGDIVYVVPSYTMPDNVVMNNGLYPAEEIEKSWQTLENTPAPLAHPMDANGNYVSANSPDGIIYYQAGVFNKNVQRVSDEKYGHRLYVEKHIHLETAMKSERGKRLIEAIDKGEPIHSSTGVLVDVEQTSGVMNGKPYEWIARDFVYDHDAILLDEEGAATPDDGTGLLINKHLIKNMHRDGQTFAVHSAKLDIEQPEPEAKLLDNIKLMLEGFFNRGNPATQHQEGNDMYKEHIEGVLKANKIDYSKMTDEQKIEAYDALKGNAAEQPETKGEQGQPKGETVVNADVESLVERLVNEKLTANKQEQEKAERAELAEKLKANKVDLDEADQASMSVNALRAFVKSTTPGQPAYNVASGQLNNNSDESRFTADTLPE